MVACTSRSTEEHDEEGVVVAEHDDMDVVFILLGKNFFWGFAG